MNPSCDDSTSGIVLIGLPSAGKSTVGRLLAQRLGRPFLDLDACIVDAFRCRNPDVRADSARDVFLHMGEDAFRRLEAEILEQTVRERPGGVLAVGGGAPMRAENVRRMRRYGVIVYLQATYDAWLARARAGKGVPAFLAGPDVTENDLRRFYLLRHNAYADAADITVPTDDSGPRSTAAAVEHVWKRFRPGHSPGAGSRTG